MEDKLNIETTENQLKFVNIIKEFPIILEKSNVPQMKRKRSAAIIEIKGRIEGELGLQISEFQIWKKLQNMKTRIKRKSDVNKTGNKKIVLKDWEKEFLDFLEADSNPAIVRMTGK